MSGTGSKVVWRAGETAARGREFTQRLNPNSRFIGAGPSRLAGMRHELGEPSKPFGPA